MRVALLVLLVGCEIEATPPTTTTTPLPPRVEKPAVEDGVMPQQINVTVLEYRTEKPISGATIELLRTDFCDYSNGPPCPDPMVREWKTTDVDGHMKLSAPVRTGWRVERVFAPGYATDCPTDADPFGEYDLVQDNHYFHDQDVSYVCHLVPPSALVIRDRKAAIAAAKKHPGIEDWLRTHRDARATAIPTGVAASATAIRTGMAASATASENAAAWRVDFEKRSGQDHEVAFVSGLGLVWLPDWPMAAPTIPPSGRR